MSVQVFQYIRDSLPKFSNGTSYDSSVSKQNISMLTHLKNFTSTLPITQSIKQMKEELMDVPNENADTLVKCMEIECNMLSSLGTPIKKECLLDCRKPNLKMESSYTSIASNSQEVYMIGILYILISDQFVEVNAMVSNQILTIEGKSSKKEYLLTAARGPWNSGNSSGGSSTPATRSPTRTAAECCTATSSQTTSCSANTGRLWSSTGGWRS